MMLEGKNIFLVKETGQGNITMILQVYISDKKIAEFLRDKGYLMKADIEDVAVKEHHNSVTISYVDVTKVQIDGYWYTLENAIKLLLPAIAAEIPMELQAYNVEYDKKESNLSKISQAARNSKINL